MSIAVLICFLIAMIGSGFIGFFIGVIITRLNASKTQASTTPKTSNVDPRIEIANDMFADAQKLFKKSAKQAKEGYFTTSEWQHNQAEIKLARAKKLIDEVNADNAKYGNSNDFTPLPYPTEGYGI